MSRFMHAVPLGRPSFLDGTRCLDVQLLDAHVAALGLPFTTPTDLASSRAPSSTAPATVREQSLLWSDLAGAYDFDVGTDLFAGRQIRVADVGDLVGRPGRYAANAIAATELIRLVAERGALPVILGGDGAVTLSAARAFAGRDGLCVVRLAAGLAWREEVNGVHEGAPSALRRAAELPWVTGVLVAGLRGPGAARPEDVAVASAFGACLIRAEEVHRGGAQAVLDALPTAGAYHVSIDAAAVDPAIAPGVSLPQFGGLTYTEARDLLRGIAERGPVAGIDLHGIVPSRDLNHRTSLLGARLVADLLGVLARQGMLGDRADPGIAPGQATATIARSEPAPAGSSRSGSS